MSIKEKITFRVMYKPHPDYEGPHQPVQAEGCHGKFETKLKANEAAANCKAYFNVLKKAVERADKYGKVEVDVETSFHDNVIVWIQRYKDGFHDEAADELCEAKSSTPAAEEKKSRRTSSLPPEMAGITR